MITAGTVITRSTRNTERSGIEEIAMTRNNQPWQEAVPGGANGVETTPRQPERQGTASMERYLFFGHVIDTIARGSAFRTYFSRFLKIAAAGIAFAGIIALFNAWQFTARQEPPGIIGGLTYMFFLATGIYMVVHATIIRTGHIASLPDGDYTLIPLCAVLSLLVGEAYAAFSASVSLGGGVLIWFTQDGAYKLLQDVSPFVPRPGGSDFLAGILFMIRGLLRAAVVLTGGYLASELFRVVGKMAEEGTEVHANKE
jgi:hypothetical protein